jgi:uncharacterized protein YaiI (UPF0178 family)
MTVFIDGDSFAKQAREVVIRAALKGRVQTHFVANQPISLPVKCAHIMFTQVTFGEGIADDFIVDRISAGDLVLTRDILLAKRILSLAGLVMNDRGDEFTWENIEARVRERDKMQELREMGFFRERQQTQYNKKDVAKFSIKFYGLLRV